MQSAIKIDNSIWRSGISERSRNLPNVISKRSRQHLCWLLPKEAEEDWLLAQYISIWGEGYLANGEHFGKDG